MSGCRDCPACTAPAVWRATRLLLVSWWVWMLRVLVRTCPQCGHVRSRHARR